MSIEALKKQYAVEKDEKQRMFLFREKVEYGGKNFSAPFKACKESEEVAWKLLEKALWK